MNAILAVFNLLLFPHYFSAACGNYTSCPVNLQGWRLLCQQYAEHFAASGAGRLPSYGTTGPGCLLDGDCRCVFEVYRHGALGIAPATLCTIRRPALSLNIEWATQFLQFVKAHSLRWTFILPYV